jgi:hypothetical protein
MTKKRLTKTILIYLETTLRAFLCCILLVIQLCNDTLLDSTHDDADAGAEHAKGR